MKYIFIMMLFITSIVSNVIASVPQLPDILKVKPKLKTKLPTTFKRIGPTIQIGILLDTSSSMNGLINQAKEQLWKIVNEVAKANKNNKTVAIQVGLFEYGKDSLPKYEGYIQMLHPLTNDLNIISDELFKLKTNGGSEYAGKVILESVNRFAWSNHKDDLKILIIAGNEQFTQGNVPYRKAIKKARDNNIIVNTIFCGRFGNNEAEDWKKGAEIGGGKYFTINQDNVRAQIRSPFDKEIIKLGSQINKTYIYFGDKKKVKKYKTAALKQEESVKKNSLNSYVEKNIFKSKKQATIASAEMITAYNQDYNFINNLKENYLPENLQGKSKKEIKKFVRKQGKIRKELQQKIKVLEKKRNIFIKSKEIKNNKNLGSAIVISIRKQAIANGFTF